MVLLAPAKHRSQLFSFVVVYALEHAELESMFPVFVEGVLKPWRVMPALPKMTPMQLLSADKVSR